MTSILDPRTEVLPSLINADNVDLQNIAKEYLSNLTSYLKNITIVSSRPRPSDLIQLDTYGGLFWVIVVPIIYFVAVTLILGFLFLFFWYADSNRVISATHSEVSVVSSSGNTVRHETVVVNSSLGNSLRQSIVRSYLINTIESPAAFRASDTSKGSTRSLGVLTEKDLQMPSNVVGFIRKNGFTAEDRRLSKSIQEYPDENGCVQGLTSGHVLSTSRRNCQSGTSFASNLEMADIATTTSKNGTTFSTDSLEDSISRDSLRASMESHMQVWVASGEIGPEYMYGRNKVKSETDFSSTLVDVNMNYTRDCNKDGNVVFKNPVFSDQNAVFQDTDEHLKEAYETAQRWDNKGNAPMFGADHNVNFSYRIAASSSPLNTTLHCPSNGTFGSQVSKSTPLGCALAKDKPECSNRTPQTRQSERSEPTSRDAGTNVRHIYTFHAASSARNLLTKKPNLHKLNSCDFKVSPVLKQYESYEVVGEEPLSPDVFENQDCYLLEMGGSDLDISSVSQRIGYRSDEFDRTKGSLDSEAVSQHSASNSLPSSIARYHSSKVGQFPTPSAGYPLPFPENVMLDATTAPNRSKKSVHCDDSQGNHSGRSSLYANFGSCSKLSSVLSSALLSPDNSSDLSQDVGETCKHNQGFVKLTKRPSPVTSFVNNLRHRYSLDENFLNCRRGTSVEDEEESLIRSPLIPPELGTKHKRYQSLNFKRDRISVEQRLQEFGFLTNNGKNRYMINPSPGKFETGSGCLSHNFSSNGDMSSKVRSASENDRWQWMTPEKHRSTGCDNQIAKSAQSDKYEAKPTSSQLAEGSINKYQYPPYKDSETYYLQIPHFQHTEVLQLEEVAFDGKQNGRQVFEIHDGDLPSFTDIGQTKDDREYSTGIQDFLSISSRRTSNNVNRNGNHIYDSSRRKPQGTLLETRQPFLNEEERCAFDVLHTLKTRNRADEDIYEVVRETEPWNNTTRNTGVSHVVSSHENDVAMEAERIMKTNDKDCVIGKGQRLKRQHTSRVLVLK